MCNIPYDVQKGILSEFARVCRGPIIVGFSHDSRVMRLRNVVKKVFGASVNDYPVSPATLEMWAGECGLSIRTRTFTIPFLSEEVMVVFHVE
jgi:hypothetical protein